MRTTDITFNVTVTDEGVIIDFFEGDEAIATFGRTFQEWAENSEGIIG
jgi:hypothetical protein